MSKKTKLEEQIERALNSNTGSKNIKTRSKIALATINSIISKIELEIANLSCERESISFEDEKDLKRYLELGSEIEVAKKQLEYTKKEREDLTAPYSEETEN